MLKTVVVVPPTISDLANKLNDNKRPIWERDNIASTVDGIITHLTDAVDRYRTEKIKLEKNKTKKR